MGRTIGQAFFFILFTTAALVAFTAGLSAGPPDAAWLGELAGEALGVGAIPAVLLCIWGLIARPDWTLGQFGVRYMVIWLLVLLVFHSQGQSPQQQAWRTAPAAPAAGTAGGTGA